MELTIITSKSIWHKFLLTIALLSIFSNVHGFPLRGSDILQCSQSLSQSLIFRESVNATNTNGFDSSVIVHGNILHNDGSIVMKVIPIYSNNQTNSTIIGNLHSNYSSFSSQIYEGMVDLEAMNGYRDNHLINLNLSANNFNLTEIVVVFYRANLASDNVLISSGNIPNPTAHCITQSVTYSINQQSNKQCPPCSQLGSVQQQNTCNITTGRCICRADYFTSDCSKRFTRLYLNDDGATTLFSLQTYIQKHYFYYLSDSHQGSQFNIRLVSETNNLNVLISRLSLSAYPYISTSSVYNAEKDIDLSAIIKVNEGYALLITVTNMQTEPQNYVLKLQIQQFSIVVKILLIVIGCIIGVLLIFVTIFYCVCGKVSHSKNAVANVESSVKIFPALKYSTFQKYIIENHPVSRRSQMCQQQDQKVCAICLDQISPSSIIRYTYCNHILDAKCLQSWMNRQQNCPLCREPFDYNNVLEWETKIKSYVKIVIYQQQMKAKDKKQKLNQKVSKQQRFYQLKELQCNDTMHTLNARIKRQYVAEQQVAERNSKSILQNTQNLKFSNRKILKSPHKMNSSIANSRNSKYQIQQLQGDFDFDEGIDSEIYILYKSIWLYHHDQKTAKKTEECEVPTKSPLTSDPHSSNKNILHTLSDQPNRELIFRQLNHYNQFEINFHQYPQQANRNWQLAQQSSQQQQREISHQNEFIPVFSNQRKQASHQQ